MPFVASTSGKLTGVHNLVIETDNDGSQYILLVSQKRPPFGGMITLELPGGGVDPGQSLLEAAEAETQQETGYQPTRSTLLSPTWVANMPALVRGVIAFALVETDESHLSSPNYCQWEQAMSTTPLKLPLDTFLDGQRFNEWLKEKGQQGYIIGQDILAARGLYLMKQANLAREALSSSKQTANPSPISRWWQGLKAVIGFGHR